MPQVCHCYRAVSFCPSPKRERGIYDMGSAMRAMWWRIGARLLPFQAHNLANAVAYRIILRDPDSGRAQMGAERETRVTV